MYRCQCCDCLVRSGQPRLTTTVLRPDKTIQAEHPVCGACKRSIDEGVPFDDLADRHRPERGKPKLTGEKRPPPASVGGKSLLKRKA